METDAEIEKRDSRYAKFSSAIEKNLASFEAISEWADIIAFLTRLCKTLMSFPQYPFIPRKNLVAKRLAQCLNPNLPSGVHQKTLETYSIIFQKIGSVNITLEIPTYSPGFFPFFEFASSSVRLEFLDIVNRFFVPLDNKLLPILRTLILGLLPGLEEINTECFARTFQCIQSIAKSLGWDDIFESLWYAMIISSKLRVPVCNFFMRLLKQNPKTKDLLIRPASVGTIVTALVLGFSDPQPLVVRSVLDLMALVIDVSDEQVPQSQKIALVARLLKVLLRRDMSLSRRVYHWLLGGVQTQENGEEKKSPPPVAHGKNQSSLIKHSLQFIMLENPTELDDKSLCYVPDILLALCDRTELYQVTSDVVADVIISMSEIKSLKELQELPRTLGSLDAFVNLFGRCQLWTSFLNYLEQHDDPDDITALLLAVSKVVKIINCVSRETIPTVMHFYHTLLSKDNFNVKLGSLPLMQNLDDVLKIVLFSFEAPGFIQETSNMATSPYNAIDDYVKCLRQSCLFIRNLKSPEQQNFEEFLQLSSKLLMFPAFFRDQPQNFPFVYETASLIINYLQEHKIKSPNMLAASITWLEAYSCWSQDTSESSLNWPLRQVATAIFEDAWDNLLENSQFSLIFIRMLRYLPAELDIFLATQLNQHENIEITFKKFSTIWNLLVKNNEVHLINSTVVAVAKLVDVDPQVRQECIRWLKSSSSRVSLVIDPLLRIVISTFSVLRYDGDIQVPFYVRQFDSEQVEFALKMMLLLLNLLEGTIGQNLLTPMVPSTQQALIDLAPERYRILSDTVQGGLLLHGVLSAILILSIAEGVPEVLEIETIHSISHELLRVIIENYSTQDELVPIFSSMHAKLLYCAVHGYWSSQLLPLATATSILKRTDGDRREEFDKILQVAENTLSICGSPECVSSWCDTITMFVHTPDSNKNVATSCSTLLQRIQEFKNTEGNLKLFSTLVSGLCQVLCAAIKPVDEKSVIEMQTQFGRSQKGPEIKLKIDRISAFIPLFLTALAEQHFPLNDLENIVEKLTDTNCYVYFYHILDYLQDILERKGKDQFFLKTSLLEIPLVNTALFDCAPTVYQAMKDRKSHFSKIQLEPFLYIVCNFCSKETEASYLPSLNALLVLILRDVLGAPARQRNAMYLIIQIACEISRKKEWQSLLSIELQDNLSKNIELAIPFAAKCNDSSQWIDTDADQTRMSPYPSAEFLLSLSKDRISCRIFLALLEVLFPQLDKIWSEIDRVQPILLGLLSQLIIPNFKNKLPFLVTVARNAMKRLFELTALIPLWKKEFWDMFMESQNLLFDTDLVVSLVKFLHIYLQDDSDKLVDLINRIPSSQSSNLFQSKDLENLNRALLLRRLALVSYCAELELVKLHLPLVQERIMDVLRSGTSSTINEAYLLVRVLLYRLADDFPATIWPAVFTEIQGLFYNLSSATDMSSCNIEHIARAARLLDLVSNMALALPLLHLGIVIGNPKEIEMLSRVVHNAGWSMEEQLTSAGLRRPLVPLNLRTLEDLKPFFMLLPRRLYQLEIFQVPLHRDNIEEEFLFDFATPIQL